jgi:hypothetical protein
MTSMSNSSSVWNEAYSEVGDSGFMAKVLGTAYDSTRFKKYARDIKRDNAWNENAANEMIWQAATKMTAQGVVAGLPGGLLELATGTADIASLLYHTVEMCGVLAEIYGLDTSKDSVKAFVLAGASGNINVMDKVQQVMFVGGNVANDLVSSTLLKSVMVPVLKALGVKVGVRGGLKTASLIPIVGALVDGGTNCWMVNDTGHKFLKKLKCINNK